MGSTVSSDKPLREGDREKRAAIISAARELFARQGVDSVSMDAVAARAGVSKRTVYDYFGDKNRLFLAILSETSDTLNASIQHALDRHLPMDGTITTVPGLQEAITALVLELGRTLVGSADYAAAFALVAQRRWREPGNQDDVVTVSAEDALADRVAHFANVGLLDTDDPSMAAGHLAALTILLAYNDQPDPATADPERIRQIMTSGARAFIRAYATR
ncbi:TetR/AcrR family transcriptional regulator [Nonomuraea sp. NN258]|uniref:TetR/AcrR family transcriptional regulator n=1 Tax=Nonomuraea antri TaxID=2730852 RepID=UPI0015684D2A|nr:TetR/AcrR family transcriptional regulator [Nonomuraea antri]NRQ33688.1 TetR/AcrR family transcriptional regulator [Nonomuraea antri]